MAGAVAGAAVAASAASPRPSAPTQAAVYSAPAASSSAPATAASPASTSAPAAPGPNSTLVTRKRRFPWVRRILLVIGVLILAFLVWIVGLMIYAATSLHKVEALSPHPIADTSGTVWLLVGSDSREDLSAEEQKELHTGNEEGQRTDTIMLVHMKAGEEPTLVSIPRDSWVTIPAHTSSSGKQVAAQQAKINAAFAYGGAPLLSETIEYNTGLHVDNYMEIGMSGIVALTDAVGGIEVCFEEPIKDENSGLDVEAGCQILDGQEALAWVRMRYADPKGDIGRIERQQEYVRLMMHEILSWETLLHPGRQLDIVNAVIEAITVDLDTGSVDLGRFGLGMGKVAAGKGEVTSVPTNDSDHWVNGQWVLKWDTDEAYELFASMGGQTPPAESGQ